MKVLLLLLFITAGSMHSYSLESGTRMPPPTARQMQTDQPILWDDITSPLRTGD